MNAYLAATDNDWFRFLADQEDVDEVNLWYPKPWGGRFRVLSDGHPLLFKLKSPFNLQEGNGVVAASDASEPLGLEAGLILIEQRARDAVDHVLVVCPASLTVKWKEEMWERFDEEFRILSSAEFRGLHDRWTREGPPLEFQGHHLPAVGSSQGEYRPPAGITAPIRSGDLR